MSIADLRNTVIQHNRIGRWVGIGIRQLRQHGVGRVGDRMNTNVVHRDIGIVNVNHVTTPVDAPVIIMSRVRPDNRLRHVQVRVTSDGRDDDGQILMVVQYRDVKVIVSVCQEKRTCKEKAK